MLSVHLKLYVVFCCIIYIYYEGKKTWFYRGTIRNQSAHNQLNLYTAVYDAVSVDFIVWNTKHHNIMYKMYIEEKPIFFFLRRFWNAEIKYFMYSMCTSAARVYNYIVAWNGYDTRWGYGRSVKTELFFTLWSFTDFSAISLSVYDKSSNYDNWSKFAIYLCYGWF